MALNAKAVSKTTMQVSINRVNKTIEVRNNALKKYPLGNIEIADTGYVAIILKCVKKAGANFVDIPSFNSSLKNQAAMRPN